MTQQHDKPSLRRNLGLFLFVLFGVGNIVGAGIYVLIGKVAGAADLGAPLAFLLAGVVAGLTGLSYGELAARYPYSSGEAIYLYKAFGRAGLSLLTGLLIALAGLVSAATIARGFVGYFQSLLDVPQVVIIVAVFALLTTVAARGIRESAWFNALLTVLQVGGLLWIIVVGGLSLAAEPLPSLEMFLPNGAVTWGGVFAGAFLAFYAFIGFEDMVNLAEEVREPQKNMPRGIVLAFVISTLVYTLLVAIAVLVVAPSELAASDAPLIDVCAATVGCSTRVFSILALTVLNGALMQLIMASRLLFGMSRRGWLPAWLAHVSATRGTPLPATLLAGGTGLALALTLPLVSLAKITSGLVLTVFILVNISLLVIKRRVPAPEGVTPVPPVLPVLGLAGSVLMILAQAV